jgi:hypothetical protein
MSKKSQKKHYLPFLIGVLLFVIFYPMLISIYVFLPLFIGSMSYILILGIEKEKTSYIIFSSLYLINLEVNLSLPLFLTIISSFIFYVTLFLYLQHFRQCKLCKPLISVVILDLFYLGALFAFDFIFQVQSIELDIILLYTLIVDMLIVVLL